MLRVALTGGIASGKSAVADIFAHRGVPVIDTDVIARQVVEPGTPGLAAIRNTFGDSIIDAQGHLDRRALRDQVFSDPQSRDRLEQILHPLIMQEAEQQVAALDSGRSQLADHRFCIVVIPLLLEAGLVDWPDRIVVVDVAWQTQLERLRARDQVSLEQAQAALAAQASREQRLQIADHVLSNEGTLEDLRAQVGSLHEQLNDWSLRQHEARTTLAVQQADAKGKL